MVGNDVVDLLDPRLDRRPSRDRFDARICRPAECEAIRTAPDPSRERWCHWAAKEASYKLLRKQAPETIFSPIRFEVEFEPDAHGVGADAEGERRGHVVHGVERIDLWLRCRDGAVHALATPRRHRAGDDRGELVVGLRRLDDRDEITPSLHSRAVRRLAIATVAARLGVSTGRIAIVKRDRIPEFRFDGAPIGIDLSLSHHGRVVAFASRMPSRLPLERLAS